MATLGDEGGFILKKCQREEGGQGVTLVPMKERGARRRETVWTSPRINKGHAPG